MIFEVHLKKGNKRKPLKKKDAVISMIYDISKVESAAPGITYTRSVQKGTYELLVILRARKDFNTQATIKIKSSLTLGENETQDLVFE